METDQAKSRLSTAIAIVLLAFFVVLSVASIWNDSATMDESVHIPAAYSYLSQKDMRLNPEHPPLLKDLSAVPLLLMKINFPAEHPSWAENINDQWAFGPKFLYESGNDADEIIFWARIFPILLAAFLGYFLFVWAGKNFGRHHATHASPPRPESRWQPDGFRHCGLGGIVQEDDLGQLLVDPVEPVGEPPFF